MYRQWSDIYLARNLWYKVALQNNFGRGFNGSIGSVLDYDAAIAASNPLLLLIFLADGGNDLFLKALA